MSENKVQASPSARRLAKELGVDLSEVYKKIGNKRIQAKDVERYYYEGPDENTVRDDVDEAFSLAEEPTAQDLSLIHISTNKSQRKSVRLRLFALLAWQTIKTRFL